MSNSEYSGTNCQERLSPSPYPRTNAFAMYEHVAETYVLLLNANCSLDQLCSTITAFSHSVIEKGSEKTFVFEGGHAIIRLVDGGLLFRVTAENMLIFFGIRTILENSLSKISDSIPEWIRWYPTESAHSPSPNA
ncbi:SMa0974 family conjugal transfer regulator [Rhizobium rhizogenes]|uniref:SMa0974 family conjugal transfer regulator n=1 Tax=Rhizobium rhizogenes TaxID=359 RepID=UPI001571D2BD|nr:hypothetical protein [Rhizobium rhizogenes]NTG09338.1 DUF2218 domain-containing protein [Rhizobium rhizogenes]